MLTGIVVHAVGLGLTRLSVLRVCTRYLGRKPVLTPLSRVWEELVTVFDRPIEYPSVILRVVREARSQQGEGNDIGIDGETFGLCTHASSNNRSAKSVLDPVLQPSRDG